jgi:hypothetical protein
MNPAERFHVHARSFKHKKTGTMICIHRNTTMLGLHIRGIKLSEYIPRNIINDPKEK